MTNIDKAKILLLATDGFEESELQVPLKMLRQKGATVEIAAPAKTRKPGEIRGWAGESEAPDWGDAVSVDHRLEDVDIDRYDALVLPGGVINPDKLRLEPRAIDIVKRFASSGKIVGAICHGPWLLVEAGVAHGRRMTSFASIKTDVKNAGAKWSDEEVVVDDGIITSRSPKDLPAFVAKIVEEIGEGRHDKRRTAA